jgi:Fe-S cluster assembly ATP-binding protein
LANVLAGHPFYTVDQGDILMDGQSILEKAPDERSTQGLFLAFQYPIEVPGVKVQNFLRLAHQARFSSQPKKQFSSVLEFRKYLQSLADELQVNPELLKRGLNEGFSGGEKKRLEVLQMAVLEPHFAILDESDSGLDVDAIKAVAAGVKKVIEKYHTGVIVITHYQRILQYLSPDFVHVMVNGKIVQSGGQEVAEQLESEGYSALK